MSQTTTRTPTFSSSRSSTFSSFTTPPPHSHPPDFDAIDLSRALNRLEAKILAQPPPSRLLRSSLERRKTAAALEHARTLLLRLEHNASFQRVQSRKHAAQTRLQQQRALIKQLTSRLFELGQEAEDDAVPGHGLEGGGDSGGGGGGSGKGGGEEVDEDGFRSESILTVLGLDRHGGGANQQGDAEMGVADRKTPSSTGANLPPLPQDDEQRSPSLPSLSEQTNNPSNTSTKDSNSTLRARRTALLGDTSATATTTAHAIKNASSNDPRTSKTTAVAVALENNDATHAQLTASMVALAAALKKSAQTFAQDLAADNQTLSATEQALGKNISGMDAATNRMGVLRKMSEGRWWWGRMVLYAAIAALWVLAIGLVFLGPKLR